MPKPASIEAEAAAELSLEDDDASSDSSASVRPKSKSKNKYKTKYESKPKRSPLKGVRRFAGVRLLSPEKIFTHDRRTGLRLTQRDLIAAQALANTLEYEWQLISTECSEEGDHLEKVFEEKVARMFRAPFAK